MATKETVEGTEKATVPINVGKTVRDPFQDGNYVAAAKRVLTVVDLKKDGAAFKGGPIEGSFDVSRVKHTADVRSGTEICWLLKKLFPNATFKWIGIMLALLCSLSTMAADTVAPAQTSMTNKRDDYVSAISGTYYRGTSLLFTNCLMYAGTGGTGTVQGLNGVTIDVTVSDGTTSSNFQASAISTNLGTYWFSLNLSTSYVNQANVQVKITDDGGTSYIYPWKVLNMTSPLQ